MSTSFLPAARTVSGLGFVAFLSIGLPATAFHEGGTGYCEGCHGLHRPTKEGGTSSASLLIGSDPSSTCLSCHAEPGKPYTVLSSDGSSLTPGGDFYWLKRSYSWVKDGKSETSPGHRHGHNVTAADQGLRADPTLSVAPGGSFPASALGCTSCHAPHGISSRGRPIAASGSYGATPAPGTAVGTYRMLGGVDYEAGPSGEKFTHGAPVAVAPLKDWAEKDDNHVAYGSGMSEWCGNCHAALLAGAGRRATKHPAGADAKFSAGTTSIYNSYVKTGDLTGTQSKAYLALVPFELGVEASASLNPASTDGPRAGSANVMCLTCHRAHASAFSGIGRWDFGATFLSDSHPNAADGAADFKNSYYGRDIGRQFGPYQRQLCNKCHAQD